MGAQKVRFNIGGTLEDFLEETAPELNGDGRLDLFF